MTTVEAETMAPETTAPETAALDEAAVAMLLRAATRHAFGPSFFVGQLAAFVRERCPDPAERLPHVQLWLAGGEVVTICHVIAVAPRWVAIAARTSDARGDKMEMRTELLPYELIARVTISGGPPRGRGMGFDQLRPPAIIADDRTPEQVLLAAAGAEGEIAACASHMTPTPSQVDR